jgi:hypothetical protein
MANEQRVWYGVNLAPKSQWSYLTKIWPFQGNGRSFTCGRLAYFKGYKDSTSYWDWSSPTRTTAMVFATLLTTVLLALAVAADPIFVKKSLVTLPISRRINVTTLSVLEHDQLRAAALRATGEARAAGTLSKRSSVISSTAENQAVSYVASIGVGSPATQCKRLYS